MERSHTPEYGGVIREEQNWIGGSSYNPCSAAFVPPPPEHIPELLDDLLDYINNDAHSPLVQAAIVHAQFETIHPFADGNGRTGRALIHVVLTRRGLAPRFVPPISLVLATWSDSYIAGLMTFRHLHATDSPERSEATAEWLRIFASATARSCHDAQRYADEIALLNTQWRSQIGTVRANSSVDLLLGILPGVPILTVDIAAKIINRSTARVSDAINTLASAGILTQRDIERRRYRVFEATDVLDLFTNLERTLASPSGDTRQDRPVRAVPSRPQQPRPPTR